MTEDEAADMIKDLAGTKYNFPDEPESKGLPSSGSGLPALKDDPAVVTKARPPTLMFMCLCRSFVSQFSKTIPWFCLAGICFSAFQTNVFCLEEVHGFQIISCLEELHRLPNNILS